jgi:hypothetical protein
MSDTPNDDVRSSQWAIQRAERKAHAEAMLRGGREVWWADLNEAGQAYWLNRCGSVAEAWETWKLLKDDLDRLERVIRALGALPHDTMVPSLLLEPL